MFLKNPMFKALECNAPDAGDRIIENETQNYSLHGPRRSPLRIGPTVKKKKTLFFFFFFPEESLAQTFNIHKFTIFSLWNNSKVDVLEERFLKAKNILPVHGIWNLRAPVDSLTLEIYMTRNTNHNSLVSTKPSQAKPRQDVSFNCPTTTGHVILIARYLYFNSGGPTSLSAMDLTWLLLCSKSCPL